MVEFHNELCFNEILITNFFFKHKLHPLNLKISYFLTETDRYNIKTFQLSCCTAEAYMNSLFPFHSVKEDLFVNELSEILLVTTMNNLLLMNISLSIILNSACLHPYQL